MNTNEITVKNENGGAVIAAENYKEIAIHWLESTGNLQKFNAQEKAQFIDICQAYGLNPIKKEVYGVMYEGKNGRKFNLIVGYESYIKRAEASGRLDGWNVEISGNMPNLTAKITIYRKDWEKPFIHEVYFEEYNTNRDLWLNKPRTMLKKVAIAQGFRMCFSEVLGGMPYTADELSDEMTHAQEAETTAPTVKTASPKKSEKPVKNITPKYTKQQAAELGAIMNAKAADGSDLFNEAEKQSARELLMCGNFEEAIKTAKELKAKKEAVNVEATPAADPAEKADVLPAGLHFSPEVEAEINEIF